MRKFLLSAIGIFVSACVVPQFTKSNNLHEPVNKNFFTDSVPKDGTIISYSYIPKDNTITDTMIRNKHRFYRNTCRTMKVIKNSGFRI